MSTAKKVDREGTKVTAVRHMSCKEHFMTSGA